MSGIRCKCSAQYGHALLDPPLIDKPQGAPIFVFCLLALRRHAHLLLDSGIFCSGSAFR